MFNIIFSVRVQEKNIQKKYLLWGKFKKSSKIITRSDDIWLLFYLFIYFILCARRSSAHWRTAIPGIDWPYPHTLSVTWSKPEIVCIFCTFSKILSQILHNNKIYFPREYILHLELHLIRQIVCPNFEHGLCQWVQLEFCQLSCCPFRSCLLSDLHRSRILMNFLNTLLRDTYKGQKGMYA